MIDRTRSIYHQGKKKFTGKQLFGCEQQITRVHGITTVQNPGSLLADLCLDRSHLLNNHLITEGRCNVP